MNNFLFFSGTLPSLCNAVRQPSKLAYQVQLDCCHTRHSGKWENRTVVRISTSWTPFYCYLFDNDFETGGTKAREMS